jgi:hypothetical protein
MARALLFIIWIVFDRSGLLISGIMLGESPHNICILWIERRTKASVTRRAIIGTPSPLLMFQRVFLYSLLSVTSSMRSALKLAMTYWRN